jgi:hypothetical protein
VSPIKPQRIPRWLLDSEVGFLRIVLVGIVTGDRRRGGWDGWLAIRSGLGRGGELFGGVFALAPLELSHAAPLAGVYSAAVRSRGVDGGLEKEGNVVGGWTGLSLFFGRDFGRGSGLQLEHFECGDALERGQDVAI